MATPTFPNYTIPFPYQNLPQQLQASLQGPQLSNGSGYGRFNFTNNNAFGLAPFGGQGLFGQQMPQQGPWQPPWGNNAPPNMQLPMLPNNTGPGIPPLPTGAMPPGSGSPPPGAPPSVPGGVMRTPPPGGYPGLPQSGGSMSTIGAPVGIPKVAQQGLLAPGTRSVGQQYGVGSFNANPGSAGPVNAPIGQNQMTTVNANGGGGPVSFSPAQFRTVMGQDPALALQMLSAGGQQYSNAVMQNMGWNNDQMNQFINNTSYNTPSAGGWTPQNIALLRSLGIGNG